VLKTQQEQFQPQLLEKHVFYSGSKMNFIVICWLFQGFLASGLINNDVRRAVVHPDTSSVADFVDLIRWYSFSADRNKVL